MAKVSANGATITFTITGSAHVVTPDCESYEILETRVLAEVDGFGEHVNVLPGQETYEVSIDAWFNASGTAYGISNILRLAKAAVLPVAVAIKPASSTQTFSGTFYHEGTAVSGEKKGEGVKLGTITFKPANGYSAPSWS